MGVHVEATVKIDARTAAFGADADEAQSELARVLEQARMAVARGVHSKKLLDLNGNYVGNLDVTIRVEEE